MANYQAHGVWRCADDRLIKRMDIDRIEAASVSEATTIAKREFNKQRPSRRMGVGKRCQLKMIVWGAFGEKTVTRRK